MDVTQIATAIASAYERPHIGVASRIGEVDTVTQILQAVDDGNYIETAAELAGISKKAIYEWLKRGEDGEEPFKAFGNALKRAQARAEAVEVAKVRAAGKDPRFWAASMTFLERRHADKWARRSEDTSSPRVVVQIGVRDSDVSVQLSPSVSPDIHRLTDGKDDSSV